LPLPTWMQSGLEGLLRVSLREALRGLFTGVAFRSSASSHNAAVACPVIPACPPWSVDIPACPTCGVDCHCPRLQDLQGLCPGPWFERSLWVALILAAWVTGRARFGWRWASSAASPDNVGDSPSGRAAVQKKLRALES